MNKEEITEGNKLIAEFMGFKLVQGDIPGLNAHKKQWRTNDVNSPLWNELEAVDEIIEGGFFTSWDWLMPVVEKIESLGYKVVITRSSCNVYDLKGNCPQYEQNDGKTKIEQTFVEVTNFIKWYNQNK